MNPQEGYSEPDSPFGPSEGPTQEPQPEPEPAGKSFDLWGLRNSSPPVTPSEIGYQLDLSADWWEHMFCGFLKQSNSDAAEAWQHYVIAGVLLVDQQYGLLDDSDREAIEERQDGWGDLGEK